MDQPVKVGNAHILLIEDDYVDIEIFKRALGKANIKNPVMIANDGTEGIEILKDKKIPQPCIILLDINMPRMNGFQFLEEIRNDSTMKQNIVFMLTTSGRKSDIMQAYQLHAAGYVMKENVAGLASMLSEYCRVSEFPGSA